MTTYEQVIEAARIQQQTERDWEAVEREARRQSAEDEMAAARDELLALFGPLAGEMIVLADDWGSSRMKWSVRPAAWRINQTFAVTKNRDEKFFRFLSGGTATFVEGNYAAVSQVIARFLLARQDEYEWALRQRVANLRDALKTVRDPDSSDSARRLDNALAELLSLAPEREDEWRALHTGTLDRLDAERAEAARQALFWDAAEDRYREALDEWVEAHEAALAANVAAVADIRRQFNRTLTVRDIEYAVIAADADGRAIETRTVVALDDGSPNTDPNRWQVLRRGAFEEWTFRHIVRVGAAHTINSADYTDPSGELFADRFSSYGVVHCMASDADRVTEAMAALPELPEPPSWEEIGAGLPFGEAARKLFYAAAGRVQSVEDIPF